jgi:hypothetical protein
MTDKIFSVSYSKLATFRRCLQQYHWKYKDKYFAPSGIGQVRGTCGHAALAIWHSEYDAQKAMDAAWQTWEHNGYEAGDDWTMLEEALNRYFIWSREHDTFTMIASELKFDIDYGDFKFTGFIDGIVQDGSQQWLLEHKFLKQVDNGTKDLDHQSSLYLLACQLQGYEVTGVLYNQIRMGTKIAEKEPVLRRKVMRNPAGLDRIEKEMKVQVQVMQRYQEGGVPYRSPGKDCSWDCSFYNACLSLQDDGIEPTDLLIQISNTRRNNED